MTERVLVTGGAGYIGGVVVAQLLQRAYDVVVLDDLSNGCRAAVPEGARLAVGDVGDRAALDRLFREYSFDAVMHFAAFIEAGESMKFPAKYFRNNTANALTLLDAVTTHKVPRFVFSSTAALYGTPERTPIEETDTLRPTNTYGETKLLVERMLEWFNRIHGLRYACLRYFNAAGANERYGEDHEPETHLIPNILAAAVGEKPEIVVFGNDYPTPDGTPIRDYIHVSDLADAHILALDHLRRGGRSESLNVGTGRGHSVLEVIECARQVTKREIRARIEAPRAGDPARLVANSSRIQTVLGWKPVVSDLRAIVQSAWVWRQRHPKGYRQP